jgi:hypothetical protein
VTDLPLTPALSPHALAALVLLSRLGDVVSTRLATPRLALEANAVVRRLGWPFAWLTLLLALTPYLHAGFGVVVLTASLLVTAGNLSRGWAARTLGEAETMEFMLRAARRGRRAAALAFTWAASAVLALLGSLLMDLSGPEAWGYWFGFGIVVYALAIALHGTSFIVRIFRQAGAPAVSPAP